jgi:hypothetical protein
MDLTIYSEVFILIDVLLGYVLRNYLVGDVIPDQITHSRPHLTAQRRPKVLRYPHQVQMNLEYGIRAASVTRHPTRLPAARVLKPSPKGEGFNGPRL